jgi:CDP-diacylglycerol--glycerol-3-phosphate 3-phosphatidyltransferase
VAVSYVGKVKTTMQMLAILVLLMAAPDRDGLLADIGCGLLILAAALTLWTMLVYLKAAWPEFKITGQNNS